MGTRGHGPEGETCGCHRELAVTILDALTDCGLYTSVDGTYDRFDSLADLCHAIRTFPFPRSVGCTILVPIYVQARQKYVKLRNDTVRFESNAVCLACIRRGNRINSCGDCAVLDEEIKNMSKHTGDELD